MKRCCRCHAGPWLPAGRLFDVPSTSDAAAGARSGAPAPQLLDAGGTPIERVPFRGRVVGDGREAGEAAGLHGRAGRRPVTEPGPVEVYRMQCDNGKVFMARCELRQCRKM
jgi:hypothetical protein